ncbi:MAG: hypothetical protein RL653_4046 [Pseudomonadota bacterium]
MPCPNASVLRDYQLEKLSDELHERVSSHVSRCRECAQAMRRTRPRMSREVETVPQVQDPLIGTRAGEYDLVQRIGHGGMGVVYLGRHPLIGKEVAVKVLRPDAAENADHARRMLKEAQAVNAIQHHAIVDIFGFGELPDGRHYLVMEFLRGEPLNDWLHRTFPAPLQSVISLLDVLCGALQAAHDARVVHRDLKPGNLFIRENERGELELKLLDFGLAKRESEKTSGRTLGTPNYMAPEQIHQKVPISPQTDLYSLGVLLYELLTGELPYGRKEDIASILRGHVDEAPRPPRELRPELPEALEHLVLDLLEKDPALRPASAEEVRQRLREIRESLVPTAEHPRVVPRRSPSLSRAPAAAPPRTSSRPQTDVARAGRPADPDDVDAEDDARRPTVAGSKPRSFPWRPVRAVLGIAALGTGLVLAGPHLGAALGSLAATPEPHDETAGDRSPVPAAEAASPALPKAEKVPGQPSTRAGSAVGQQPRAPTPSTVQRTAPAQAPLHTTPSPAADTAPTVAALEGRMDALAATLSKSAGQEEDVDTAAMGHLDRLRARLDKDDSPDGRAAVGRGLDELERLYLAK